MTEAAIFSRRTARVLTLATAVTFAVTLFFIVFGESDVEITSVGADSFSRSALGYRALVEMLEREVPVIVSRQRSEHKASSTTPLLLLEPPARPEALEHLAQTIAFVRRHYIPTVVVLPKWRGIASRRRHGWVSEAFLIPEAEPQAVLRTVLGGDEEAEVVRWAQPFSEGGALLPAPQMIRSDALVTLVGQKEHAVLAFLDGSPLYVISDPDLLNTAGLVRSGNALFVHEFLVGDFSPQAFVIDEVLHGYRRSDSIWNALLELPLICVTLHLATLLLLGLWATAARFGKPLAPPSRLPPGKMTLVENTARLLDLAERSGYAVERYLRLTVRRSARRAALPRARFRQQLARLAEFGRRRRLAEDLEELAADIDRLEPADVEPRHALELSRALYRFRESFERR